MTKRILIPETKIDDVRAAIERVRDEIDIHDDKFRSAGDRAWRAYFMICEDEEECEDDPEGAYIELEAMVTNWLADIQNPSEHKPSSSLPASATHQIIDIIYEIRNP